MSVGRADRESYLVVRLTSAWPDNIRKATNVTSLSSEGHLKIVFLGGTEQEVAFCERPYQGHHATLAFSACYDRRAPVRDDGRLEKLCPCAAHYPPHGISSAGAAARVLS